MRTITNSLETFLINRYGHIKLRISFKPKVTNSIIHPHSQKKIQTTKIMANKASRPVRFIQGTITDSILFLHSQKRRLTGQQTCTKYFLLPINQHCKLKKKLKEYAYLKVKKISVRKKKKNAKSSISHKRDEIIQKIERFSKQTDLRKSKFEFKTVCGTK